LGNIPLVRGFRGSNIKITPVKNMASEDKFIMNLDLGIAKNISMI